MTSTPAAQPIPHQLLVVEDERKMRRFLCALLESHGYQVLEAETGREALSLATSHLPEAIVLDLGLPDIDGLEIVARLREWSSVPIIILSARGLEHQKVDALDLGADDYLTKPFGAQELLARVRVALRHAASRSEEPEAIVEVGGLRIDLSKRLVSVDGALVTLTATEYRILELLATHIGKVLTHREILQGVWGPGSSERQHYVRVYMSHLRHKIERDSARPEYIITETGLGYRLRDQ